MHGSSPLYKRKYYSSIKRKKSCHLWQHGWTWEDICLVKRARHRKTSTVWLHFYWNLKSSTHKGTELNGCCQGLGVEKMRSYWSKGTNFHNWWVRCVSYGSLLYSMVTIANNTVILWGGLGNQLHYSRLENPVGLQFTGLQKVGHDWSNLARTHALYYYIVYLKFVE